MSAITTTEATTSTTPARRMPKIDFSSVNPNNLGTLRKLNQVLFPIKYSDKFYKDVLLPEHQEFCKLVYYNDIPVGTICCRIEPDPKSNDNARLYIMTMGVLAPYRSRKVGTKALQHIIDNAVAARNEALKVGSKQKPLVSLYMHVQTSNTDARRFYERHGFKEVGKIDDYYKKLEPHDAWVLERFLDQPEEETKA